MNTEEEVSFLEKSMQARVDKQYYTDREVASKQSDDMMKRAPEFVIKSKEIILQLTEKERQDIRTKIIKIREENKKGKKK